MRGRDIEGVILGAAAGRHDVDGRERAIFETAGHMRDFAGRAFFNRDVAQTVFNRPVNRRVRQRDIEGHIVGMRRERFQIGADLVADVAARGGAIRADDAEIDHAMLHQMPAGIVGDHGMRNAMRAEYRYCRGSRYAECHARRVRKR